MAWQKSPDALIARFNQMVPDDPRVERRKMFGYPAAFVNGRLFAGLHQADMVLKLPAEDRALLEAGGHARRFEPMPGRPMGDFVAIRGDTLPGPDVMNAWMARALEHVAALPAKAAKAPKGGYQRKTRGPSAAPSAPVSAMPSEYQVATNAIDASGPDIE